MATITTNVAIDMRTHFDYFIELTIDNIISQSATEIRLQAPNGRILVATGSFDYNQFGELIGGVFTGFEERSGSTVNFKATNGSVTFDQFLDFTTFDQLIDVEGLVQFALRNSDTMTGSSGNDVGKGFGGNDTMNSGGGNDVAFGGEGADTLNGDAGNDQGFGEAGNDTLNGGTGNDQGFGGAGSDTLNGDAGNDLLDGGAGNDRMFGSAGNDTYYVDSAGDDVTEPSAGGTDTVNNSITYTLGANVEKLILAGTNAINGTGNSLANTITGNGNANTLNGAAGDDTLNGAAGNDVLNGGAGADRMSGGTGNDSYVRDSTGDVVIEPAGGGTDLVRSSVAYELAASVENLILTGTAAISGTGNALANAITGNGAANTLRGEGGNDVLNGGVGNDRMIGSTGNDTYYVGSAGDEVSEPLDGGTDTVNSSIAYTLGANVENLVLTGAEVVNGTGNALANTITGNTVENSLGGGGGDDTLRGGAGNDTLNGGNGNDTLNGQGGNDSITGGAGADDFLFNTTPDGTTNADAIADFMPGSDTIVLDVAIFAGLPVGALPAEAFVSGDGAAPVDGEDRILYDTATGNLYYDADGTGTTVAVQFAHLEGSVTLTADDFLVE